MKPENNYYLSQLQQIDPKLTMYPPSFKIFANGNGQDTKHSALIPKSAKVLIEWLKNNFPNCLD